MQKGARQICREDESVGSGLPPPCSSQSGELLEAIGFFFTYFPFSCILSLLNCLSIAGLSARTCMLAHVIFFGSPEGKGVVCLPRWIEPSEPGVSTFLIALLRVNRIPTK